MSEHLQEKLPEVPEVPCWVHPRTPTDGGSTRSVGLASRAAMATRSMVNAIKSNRPRQPRVRFQDAEELKMQLHRTIHEGKVSYDVETLYWDTGIAQRIARSSTFQNFTLVMIMGYALWLSYDTDSNTADTLLEADAQFQVMEHVFCTYFLVELVVRFLAFREKRHAFYDGWFVFDALLVTMGVAEAWVMSVVLLLSNSQGALFANSSSLRLIRLLRLSRVARTARLLRAAPELLIMVKGMIAAARSMLTTGVLVVAVLYVFGIAMRQATAGSTGGDLYFSNVWKSMFSLFIYATLLDSPSAVIENINAFGVVIFLLVIALSALLLLNMLIGVMCEVVSGVSQTEREAIAEAFVREKVYQVMHKRYGKQKVASISRRELMDMLHDRQATSLLNEAGVDVIGLVDASDYIFQSDSPGMEKELSFREFLQVVISLRNSNTVTLKDIMDLRRTMHKHQSEMRSIVSEIQERVRPKEEACILTRDTLDDLPSLGMPSLGREESAQSRAFLPMSIGEDEAQRAVFRRKLRSILEHHEVIEVRQAQARRELAELMTLLEGGGSPGLRPLVQNVQ